MGRRPLSAKVWDLLQYTQRQLDNLPSARIAEALDQVEEITGMLIDQDDESRYPDAISDWLGVLAFLQDQWNRYDDADIIDSWVRGNQGNDDGDLWDIDEDDEDEDDREDLARIGDAMHLHNERLAEEIPDVIGVEEEEPSVLGAGDPRDLELPKEPISIDVETENRVKENEHILPDIDP